MSLESLEMAVASSAIEDATMISDIVASISTNSDNISQNFQTVQKIMSIHSTELIVQFLFISFRYLSKEQILYSMR